MERNDRRQRAHVAGIGTTHDSPSARCNLYQSPTWSLRGPFASLGSWQVSCALRSVISKSGETCFVRLLCVGVPITQHHTTGFQKNLKHCQTQASALAFLLFKPPSSIITYLCTQLQLVTISLSASFFTFVPFLFPDRSVPSLTHSLSPPSNCGCLRPAVIALSSALDPRLIPSVASHLTPRAFAFRGPGGCHLRTRILPRSPVTFCYTLPARTVPDHRIPTTQWPTLMVAAATIKAIN